jgi:hypothetical protein
VSCTIPKRAASPQCWSAHDGAGHDHYAMRRCRRQCATSSAVHWIGPDPDSCALQENDARLRRNARLRPHAGLPAHVTATAHKLIWTSVAYGAVADWHEGVSIKPYL